MCINYFLDTHNVDGAVIMRTNIDIDDELLAAAMAATGLSTKRATVEEGLRLVVRLRGQVKALDDLAGLGWDGDLDKTREGYRPARHR
jgi:Arc/MetJ family transcription regulator